MASIDKCSILPRSICLKETGRLMGYHEMEDWQSRWDAPQDSGVHGVLPGFWQAGAGLRRSPLGGRPRRTLTVRAER